MVSWHYLSMWLSPWPNAIAATHSYEPHRPPAGAPWQGDLRIPALEGDFSLNAANVLSADLLLRRGGLSRLAPTHDLDARQLAGLARGLGARSGMLEAIVHQHLPIFHTGEGGGGGGNHNAGRGRL